MRDHRCRRRCRPQRGGLAEPPPVPPSYSTVYRLTRVSIGGLLLATLRCIVPQALPFLSGSPLISSLILPGFVFVGMYTDSRMYLANQSTLESRLSCLPAGYTHTHTYRLATRPRSSSRVVVGRIWDSHLGGEEYYYST